MEKTIFIQRYNYAEILPFKNYSLVSQKPNLGLNTFDVENTYEEFEGDELFGEVKIKDFNHQVVTNLTSLQIFGKNTYKKKNTKFFYSEDDNMGSVIPLKLYFPKKRVFITSKDRHIINHYNRPFSSLSTHTHIRQIDLTEDKLSVRINHYQKNRTFNSRFFNKKWNNKGFTINLKTGDFYTFRVDKKHKRIRKNTFLDLKSVLRNDFLLYENIIKNCTEHHSYVGLGMNEKYVFNEVREEFTNAFPDNEFILKLNDVFKNKLNINLEITDDYESLYNAIIEYFITKKGIKVPNDYKDLLSNWYPTKKYLQKNDNKLVASILDRLSIKSKQTIKLLHLNSNIDLVRFKIFLKFFGKDDFHKFLGNLNPNLFIGKDLDTVVHHGESLKYYDVNDIKCITKNNKERHNIFKLLNEFANTHKKEFNKTFVDELYNKFRDITDHITMLDKINTTFPEIEFNATNWKSFHEEHLEFSKIRAIISRGYTISIIYDEKLIKKIETPIVSNNVTYYPVLLKKDVEYIDEGKHMHHCVGGYYEYSNSLIISVRQGSIYGDERVTCEYSPTTKKPIQERSFCNKVPPPEFEPVLNILRERISNFDKIEQIEKIKTPFSKDTIKEKIEKDILFHW